MIQLAAFLVFIISAAVLLWQAMSPLLSPSVIARGGHNPLLAFALAIGEAYAIALLVLFALLKLKQLAESRVSNPPPVRVRAPAARVLAELEAAFTQLCYDDFYSPLVRRDDEKGEVYAGLTCRPKESWRVFLLLTPWQFLRNAEHMYVSLDVRVTAIDERACEVLSRVWIDDYLPELDDQSWTMRSRLLSAVERTLKKVEREFGAGGDKNRGAQPDGGAASQKSGDEDECAEIERLAYEAYMDHRYDQARQLLQGVLAKAAGRPYAWHLLGAVCDANGECGPAIEAYRHCTSLDPGDDGAQAALAGLLMQEGDTIGARGAIEAALRIDQRSSYRWQVYADVLSAAGDEEGFARAQAQARALQAQGL